MRARLLDEIGKVKTLSSGASASGVRVHTLPTKPRDIEDDGLFHYAVMSLGCASDSGKLSAESSRYLDETTGSEKPRVYRNAVILLAPSMDGLEVASARVRDFLAWDQVRGDLKEQSKDGNDSRSRIQDTSISSDALLPEGPYDLPKEGETSRRVKGLSGAFAQLPHLPKMLKAQAILDTLVEGCEKGAFVLRLVRPDGSARTWWHVRPDDAAMADPCP